MISVFSSQWFKKYNRIITKIARLPILGEWIFNFKKFGHYVDRNRIVEITPNSVIEFVKMRGKKKVELRQHFFVRNEYALRLQKVFYPIWITFHIWDIITRPIPQLNLGFDTLTVYPDASTGSTTCDSTVRRDSVDETLSVIRSGDGSNVYPTSNALLIRLVSSTTTNQFSQLERSGMTFDTSSLTSGATISSAVLSLYWWQLFINFAGTGTTQEICSFSAATNNNIVASDYGGFQDTSFASLSISSISTASYTDNTLNASGIANISKTGISGFGVRTGWDLNNSFTGNWEESKQLTCQARASDYGSDKPKLVVTYTTSTAYTTEITEALAMVSSDLQAQALLSTIINNLALSETQTDNSQFNQSATDNLSLSDTNTNQIDRGAIVNDNLGLSETESNETKFNQAFSETLANEETTTGSIAFISNIEETIKGTESIGIITQFLSSVSDALAMMQELWGDWWEELSKHSTSWTQSSKNTTSYTQQSKNTTSWTQGTKNKTNTKLE